MLFILYNPLYYIINKSPLDISRHVRKIFTADFTKQKCGYMSHVTTITLFNNHQSVHNERISASLASSMPFIPKDRL